MLYYRGQSRFSLLEGRPCVVGYRDWLRTVLAGGSMAIEAAYLTHGNPLLVYCY